MYMHGSSLYVYASVIGVYAWIEFICICECLYGLCMDQVYMYMRVFIGVYAWMSLYVYASVYMCCMDQVICICECLYVYMHGSSLFVYAMFICVYARDGHFKQK